MNKMQKVDVTEGKDYQAEADELYPDSGLNGADIYTHNDRAEFERATHIRARKMSNQFRKAKDSK